MRELKRKGIAGFSEDATRVLASFVTSNARQAAINMNVDDHRGHGLEVAGSQG